MPQRRPRELHPEIPSAVDAENDRVHATFAATRLIVNVDGSGYTAPR